MMENRYERIKEFFIPLFSMVIISCLLGESAAVPFEVNLCAFKIDSGSCWGRFHVWGYDAGKKECVPFTYNGCLGNRNRFMTKESCESKCSEKSCAIESVTGPCPVTRVWGYEPAKQACVQYEYGGCTGLGNRFRTERACNKFCSNMSKF